MVDHKTKNIRRDSSITAILRQEWMLPIVVLTAIVFLLFSSGWFEHISNVLFFCALFFWLLAVIVGSAFAVVRHAEELAERVGEPLGTLILTLSVTGLEVMMVAAVMYGGKGGATLGRDAMFAVVMVVLNGMVGLTLLLGGLRHREQEYNLRGANAFLAVILPLAVLGLILPNFTTSSPGPTFSNLHAEFLIVMSLGLYAIFLMIQTVRHREYFVGHHAPALSKHGSATPAASAADAPAPEAPGIGADGTDHGANHRSGAFHAAMLIGYLLPLVVLAKKFAVPIDHAVHILNAPVALGGLLIAGVILSPESVAAVRAAMANELQRAINILMGSVLATIGLTVPAVLIIGFVTGQHIVLGLDPANMILLALTLGVTMLTFASPRTNVLQGAIHLLLFVAYLMLVFEG